jgi:membrane protein implicated in regulation of membrane protease activity
MKAGGAASSMIALSWWLWVLFGLFLMVCEILTPGGFFILFFGFGAAIVGVLKLLGLNFPLTVEILIFLALSVAGLVVFRRPLTRRFRRLTPNLQVDSMSGELAHAMEEIPAGGAGKVELRGTSWNARNLGEAPIAKARECRVERVDGLTLYVRGA